MSLTPTLTRYAKLHKKQSDFVYLDLESPVDYIKGSKQCISALGYTDGRYSVLEYVKFSEDCLVTDVMKNEFSSPPSEVYQNGRCADVALKELEKFADGRPIVVFGEFDKRLINIESKRYNLDLKLDFVNFKNYITTPVKQYSLSVSRLVELLDIKGDYIEHNPLHDAFKLKAIHEQYKDTPDFRKRVFDCYVQSELKSIVKTAHSLSTNLSETADTYLGSSEGVSEHFTSTLLKLLEESATFKTEK